MDVGVLGATGAVGIQFVRVLEGHPDFDLKVVTASDDSSGKKFKEVAKGGRVPDYAADMEVKNTDPGSVPSDVDFVFSALPSNIARSVEPLFADEGYIVASNASWARMEDDIPLIVPEINTDHLGLLDVQRENRGWDGALVKNPNCSTITMVLPLYALYKEFGLSSVHVSTLQAVSGAGYDGVKSMEIIDNALPYIGGEEGKMESEPLKILGDFDGSSIEPADFDVSASCNRVPTLDGHLENVWCGFDGEVDEDMGISAMENVGSLDLPSSPENPIVVRDEVDRPQPRLDRDEGGGMSVVVGRFQNTLSGKELQFDCLAHNTVRGAAGASVLNAEFLAEKVVEVSA